MYFKFPARRSAKPNLEKLPRDETSEEEAIGLIQGQIPDSKQEWWISRALDRLRMSFTYQFPLLGGNVRGGYKLDFYVHTVPLATVIEPIGNHWHTGELGADDKKRQADIENILQNEIRVPILNLWIPDMIDAETVFQRLAKELT